jgi:hypothetical protein
MQFRKPHPWDPRLAIPDYVMAEPSEHGAIRSKGLRRKTIDAPPLAPPWKPGYAYPDYVSKEPLGRGVYRTKYRPRRTVDVLIPQYLGGLTDLRLSNPLVIGALLYVGWKLAKGVKGF